MKNLICDHRPQQPIIVVSQSCFLGYILLHWGRTSRQILYRRVLNQMIIDESQFRYIQLYIIQLSLATMNGRSHLMVRSKQQLKNQLLMGFRKKQKQQVIDLQQTQQKTVLYQTPVHNQNQNISCFAQSRSILDEFSKCPIRDDQYQYSGQKFLNKFMFVKNRINVPTSAKTSVSVQTQKNLYQMPKNNVQYRQVVIQDMASPSMKTPPAKITNFNDKQQKSLIHASKNLSTFKYFESDEKGGINRILTDSILESSQQNKNIREQQQGALRRSNNLKKVDLDPAQLLQDYHSSDDIIKDTNQKQIQKKQPIIKKIHLSRPKSNTQIPIANQQMKQNKLSNNDENDDQSQKLKKLLSKKSSIKNMIIQKNREQMGKSKYASDNNINVEAPQGKWGKPQKKYMSSTNINSKYQTKPIEQNETEDLMDLLPPYQSSQSGLQAVIQEQNQSEMEESVKYKKNSKKTNKIIRHYQDQINPQPSQPLPLQFTPLQQKLLQQNKQVSKEPNKQKREQQSKIKKSQNTGKKQDILTDENKLIQKKIEPLKEVSLSDLNLEDLQDISQIQHLSSNKDVQSTFKKKQNKLINQEQLPDYNDSQKENQVNENELDLKKYIVNDISNDINNLKKKIQKDISIDIPKQSQKQTEMRKKTSDKGSEGPDKKTSSMLDFFDQIHDKIDFKQISKDIIDLKDKIERQSD